MPTRPIVALILLFWLGSVGFLAYRDWWPRFASNGPPPFVVELADEAVPQFAMWTLWQNDKRIGKQETRIAYQADDTFEMSTKVSEMNLSFPFFSTKIDVKIPNLRTVLKLSREGNLKRVDSQMVLQMGLGGTNLNFGVEIEGEVVGDMLVASCGMGATPPFEKEPLDPVKLQSLQVLSPMQPVIRIRGLKPGQRWTMSEIDPLSQALSQAMKQFLKKSLGDSFRENSLPFGLGETPKPITLIAEVSAEPQTLTVGEKDYRCHVIEYRGENVLAKTWVSIIDGKVLQQEAERMGDKLILKRED